VVQPGSVSLIVFPTRSLNCGIIALLYYDYALTFPNEVKYIWGAREGLFRFSTLLYALCRYSLPSNVLYLLAIRGKLGDKVMYSIHSPQRNAEFDRLDSACGPFQRSVTAEFDAKAQL